MALEDIELALLLEGIYQQYGYDFREYAPASLKRRIAKSLEEENLATISGLQERVLHDAECLQRLVSTLSVSTTAMYRDPGFYLSFRRQAVPLLRTYPFVRLWDAGCAGGQEVYSLAILLYEEDLFDRCRIYATDISEPRLSEARAGVYALHAMQEYTANYLQAGGRRAFSEYYTAQYEHVTFHPWLQQNVVWGLHNLVTDGVFNTFQAVLCRNVMIYFGRPLQARVHKLLYDSLEPFGVLGLGSRESLQFTPWETSYEALDGVARLYRKIK